MHLLKLLKTWDGNPFIITGKHSTITPCTLPKWLPADVIARMVSEFGSRLRRELVKLKQCTEIVWPWTCSTDTAKLSMNSLNSYTDVLPPGSNWYNRFSQEWFQWCFNGCTHNFDICMVIYTYIESAIFKLYKWVSLQYASAIFILGHIFHGPMDEDTSKDREGWETIMMDSQTLGICMSASEEKCHAFKTLVIYCSTLGAQFALYLAQSLKVPLLALQFYFHKRHALCIPMPYCLLSCTNDHHFQAHSHTPQLQKIKQYSDELNGHHHIPLAYHLCQHQTYWVITGLTFANVASLASWAQPVYYHLVKIHPCQQQLLCDTTYSKGHFRLRIISNQLNQHMPSPWPTTSCTQVSITDG